MQISLTPDDIRCWGLATPIVAGFTAYLLRLSLDHLLKARYHNPDIVSNSASENYCLRVVGKEVPDIRLKISFQIAKKAY